MWTNWRLPEENEQDMEWTVHHVTLGTIQQPEFFGKGTQLIGWDFKGLHLGKCRDAQGLEAQGWGAVESVLERWTGILAPRLNVMSCWAFGSENGR